MRRRLPEQQALEQNNAIEAEFTVEVEVRPPSPQAKRALGKYLRQLGMPQEHLDGAVDQFYKDFRFEPAMGWQAYAQKLHESGGVPPHGD